MSADIVFNDTPLKSGGYRDWQERIIYQRKLYKDQQSERAVQRREDAAEHQQGLLSAVNESPKGLESYMFSEALGIEDAQQARRSVPELPKPLTPDEMERLPVHAERELRKALSDSFTPYQAAQSAVWALCHAVWIADGMFGSDIEKVFLAGRNSKNLTREEHQTRNFLRRTGGIHPVRGYISLFDDCSIAAAWWRTRIADEITKTARSESEDLDTCAAHRVLWEKAVWTALVRFSLNHVTVVCSPRARAAAIVALHHLKPPKIKKRNTEGAVRALGRLSYGNNLQNVPWELLVETAKEGATS